MEFETYVRKHKTVLGLYGRITSKELTKNIDKKVKVTIEEVKK